MTKFHNVHEAFKVRVSAMIRGTHLPKNDQEVVNQQVFIDVNKLIEQGKWPEKLSHQEHLVTRIITFATARHYKGLSRVRRNQPVPASDIKDLNLDRVAWDKNPDDPWDTLEEILPSLTEKYREVVDLRLQDKSFGEIADILGISENLANVRYFRAVEKLREANKRRLKTA